jgi:hypothetical protein
MTKSILWFMQENDIRIVVFVVNLPNLPYHGALHYYHGSSYVSTPKVTNLSFPHIPAWMDILPLGVHHWRFPIILTELLPQPFPPTDPSFAAQIPTNYGERLHQQKGIKEYTKQELVLQDHYHCVLGFLTLVNTTVETWTLVQLGKRHSVSLQTVGWHLYHCPINTMDYMDTLTKLG